MADCRTPIKIYDTRVVLALKSRGPIVERKKFTIVSGSRMLFELYVKTIDPATTVTIKVFNSFTNDEITFCEVLDFDLAAPGHEKRILADFHNFIDVEITVAGGDAEFAVGMSVYDNALDTRIENSPIRVVVVNPPVNTQKVVNTWSALNIPATTRLLVTTYTVPVGKRAELTRVEMSGDNIGKYELEINSAIEAKKRTWFSGGLNAVMNFTAESEDGFQLVAGDVVELYAENIRPMSATYDARIQVVEFV